MTTVQQVIDILTKSAELAEPLHDSVDSLKFGRRDMAVTGIVVTFMATIEVIERTISLGANLIITHEGPFYSHHDSFESTLTDDSTYQAKKQLIEDNGIAIYRLHDHIHKDNPDGITDGLVQEFGWSDYVTEQLTALTVITLPESKIAARIAEHIQHKLALPYLRTAGDMSTACIRIGVLVGYRGGGPLTIPLFEQYSLDLVIYGEGPEWETPEYVRDAAYLGKQKALIVLGHAESEQPGMKLLAERLSGQLPNTATHYIAVDSIFSLHLSIRNHWTNRL